MRLPVGRRDKITAGSRIGMKIFVYGSTHVALFGWFRLASFSEPFLDRQNIFF